MESSSLLMNNVYAHGPVPEMMPGPDIVHDPAVFLHDARLNMFAPGAGPPADLVRKLNAAQPGSLPPCRGSIDWATAIDDGAVMVDGWLADPGGKHTAPWIAVRDESGRIVGTTRSLQERPDLAIGAGFKLPAAGFRGGFHDAAVGPRRLRLAGIFPGRDVRLCEMGNPMEVSGVLVQPIAQLRDVRDAPFVGAATIASGFVAGLGSASAGPQDFKPSASVFSTGGAPGHAGATDFSVDGAGSRDAVLVLPFWTSVQAAGKSVSYVMHDGTRVAAPLVPWWGWGYWRAAVLPGALARQHGGVRRIEVRDAGPGGLTVGAPMLATVRPGWSRLF